MYNRDVIGSRYNPGETAISRENAGRLEEKWRFPAKGSGEQIGVIHATPIVVDGYVYFGTATDPTFYKLTPEGRSAGRTAAIRLARRDGTRPRRGRARRGEETAVSRRLPRGSWARRS